MQIVEDQNERLRRREQLQQLAHGAVRAVALVLERRPTPVVERDQAREDVRELRPSRTVETAEALWVEAFGVLVECVDEDRERQIPLELRRGACEDELTAPVAALR